MTGDGRYKGVAPDAKLLNGKVLDDNGGGTESDIIAGMEWAAAEGADVVNMSLGSPFPSDGTDPMSQAVNRITAETGALFVIAAGNSGPGEQSIGSPAAADAALTVGAVDRDGAIADFSSRGPRIKDGAIKPDITAPGVGIVAAKAANGIIGDPVGDKHVALSGTSMAAPHVAGAAALLAGQHPDWSAEQLKAVLVASAAPNPALSVYDQGAGLVDVARATRQPVSASPASVGLGTARWPHGDDEPIVRKLTYRNSGTEPLTLRVAVDLRDEAGKPATLVTVAPSEVTIPAGGQADVTLTANTRLDAPDGRYSGVVTATGGDTAVRTPVGLDKEVESYDVELTFLDHDGKPTPEYFYRFVDLRKPKAHVDHDPSGKLTARVPKGTYYFDAFIQTPRDGEGLWPLANFNEAGITITGDTALTLDARAGTPLDVTVDRAEARSGYAATFFTMTTDWGDTGSGIVGNDFSGITFAPSRTTAPGKAAFTVASRLAKPSGPYEFVGSPYQYSVGWTTDGGVPATLSKHFRDRDLVKVSTTAAGVATSGFIDQMAGGPLPYPITEYFSRGTTWDGSFDQSATPTTWPTDSTQLTVNPREFTRPTTQRWNAAVFGPAVPAAPWSPDEWAGRDGDNLRVSVPMFTDQDPNHFGFSTVDTAKTTLHRGETLLAQSEYDGWIQASDPGGKGTYRVHTEATRSVSPLSTFISADWTFTSATTQSAEPLPLIAVRFAPNLDTTNHAPAGRLFTVPIYTQHNGTTATTVTKPTIQVSYNDGKTWHPTPLFRVGDRWHAILHHPANAEFVSFKAQAKDTQGNAVDQTIIRAYALK
ncbi:S8 family serine peptidase [Actinokineospora soli]